MWYQINSVGYAFRADAATTADSAASADEATHAQVVDETTTAAIALAAQPSDLAITASFAQNSAHAALSDHAASSDLADHATTADTADASVLALQALGLKGSAFVTAPSTGTAVQNGQALRAAYEEAKNLLPQGQPLSAENRAVLLVPPGRYDLTTGALVLDTEFVDVVGLATARENQHIYGESNGLNTGVIMQTTNNVCLENLTVECTLNRGSLEQNNTDPAAYFLDTPTKYTVLKNCVFKANDTNALSMRTGVEYAGHYTDCTGGDYAFGGVFGTASGIFTNCTGGRWAYGAAGIANGGKFRFCSGGIGSFRSDAAETSYCVKDGVPIRKNDIARPLTCGAVLNSFIIRQGEMPWRIFFCVCAAFICRVWKGCSTLSGSSDFGGVYHGFHPWLL